MLIVDANATACPLHKLRFVLVLLVTAPSSSSTMIPWSMNRKFQEFVNLSWYTNRKLLRLFFSS